jgi:hypothetical protein
MHLRSARKRKTEPSDLSGAPAKKRQIQELTQDQGSPQEKEKEQAPLQEQETNLHEEKKRGRMWKCQGCGLKGYGVTTALPKHKRECQAFHKLKQQRRRAAVKKTKESLTSKEGDGGGHGDHHPTLTPYSPTSPAYSPASPVKTSPTSPPYSPASPVIPARTPQVRKDPPQVLKELEELVQQSRLEKKADDKPGSPVLSMTDFIRAGVGTQELDLDQLAAAASSPAVLNYQAFDWVPHNIPLVSQEHPCFYDAGRNNPGTVYQGYLQHKSQEIPQLSANKKRDILFADLQTTLPHVKTIATMIRTLAACEDQATSASASSASSSSSSSSASSSLSYSSVAVLAERIRKVVVSIMSSNNHADTSLAGRHAQLTNVRLLSHHPSLRLSPPFGLSASHSALSGAHSALSQICAYWSGTKENVCRHRAMTFKMICDELKVPCLLVRGYYKATAHKTTKHVWNCVAETNRDLFLVDCSQDYRRNSSDDLRYIWPQFLEHEVIAPFA